MTLPSNATIKPLPSFIRQRLTFQSALLNTTNYVHLNTRIFQRSKHKKELEERVSPRLSVVSEKTQTKEVHDAETNTSLARDSIIESQRSKLMSICSIALAKGVVLASNHYAEITRLLRQDSSNKKISANDSMKNLPETKKRRGILKNVLEDVTIDGMCSTGTVTEKKQPTLNRILKENHIFMKYSKSCKSKKKRVRMEKKPVLSYFKRDQESVKSFKEAYKSALALEASGDKRPKLGLADDDDNSSVQSDDAHLERKPAIFSLLSDGVLDALDAELDAVSDSSRRSALSNMLSAPQLAKSEKLSRQPILRQSPRASFRAKSDESKKKTSCGVPKEKLYFKNVFSLIFTGVQSFRR